MLLLLFRLLSYIWKGLYAPAIDDHLFFTYHLCFIFLRLCDNGHQDRTQVNLNGLLVIILQTIQGQD